MRFAVLAGVLSLVGCAGLEAQEAAGGMTYRGLGPRMTRAAFEQAVGGAGQAMACHKVDAAPVLSCHARQVPLAPDGVRFDDVEAEFEIATGLAVSVMFGRAAIDQAEVGEMKRSFTARYGAPECESDADACQWKRGEFYIGLAVYRGMLTMKLADATAEDRLSQAAPE